MTQGQAYAEEGYRRRGHKGPKQFGKSCRTTHQTSAKTARCFICYSDQPLGGMQIMWGTAQYYKMPVGLDDNKAGTICVEI